MGKKESKLPTKLSVKKQFCFIHPNNPKIFNKIHFKNLLNQPLQHSITTFETDNFNLFSTFKRESHQLETM